jgi:uncharacterized RDD family membrane protein YckC
MGDVVAPFGPSAAPTALRVTAGPAAGQLILVDDELQLGSGGSGVGTLGGDEALSAAHARLTRDHTGEWMVHDLGSAEGTFLNGRQVSGIEPVHRGDTLRLGASKLLVVEGSARAPRTGISIPTPVAAPPPLEVPSKAAEGEALTPAEPAFPPPLPQRQVASDGRRLLALLIDGLIAAPIAVGIVLAFGSARFSEFLAIAVVLSWDFLFESLRGQTIGKRAMKIRVVRRDGTRLRPQHAAARNVLRIVDGLPGLPLVGLLSMTVSGRSRRQRVGDLAAGTLVVNSERAMSKLPPTTRDRLVLAAYPAVWLAPVIIWALATPGATTRVCHADVFSARPPEGTCITRLPDGQGSGLITAVNPGHTLHWQGYDISLVAARAREVRRTAGLATVVGYELAVTNTGRRPAAFSHQAIDMILNVPLEGMDLRSAPDLPSSVTIHGFHGLASSRPIASGATRNGWLRFLVPSGFAVGQLNSRLASISFIEASWRSTSGLPHLGDLRLWNPATTQGAAAIHVRSS